MKSLNRLRAFLVTPQRLIGLALLRMMLGMVVLINYVSHIKEWMFLWGPNGMVPYPLFLGSMHIRHSFSFYAFSAKPAWMVLLNCIGISVAICMVLGWHTRVMTILFALTTWSLYERNLYLLDGGDNLLYLICFWLMFCDSGYKLSLDGPAKVHCRSNPYRALFHNAGLCGIVLQITILYATSALAKIAGHSWQNGTALYYILRTDEFNLSPLTPYLWKHGYVIVLLTYSTMLFQISWPFLIWSRHFKLLVALGAALLHTMIAYFMGLTWFSMVMIAAEFAMFDDGEYRLYLNRLRSAMRLPMQITPWIENLRKAEV